MSLFSSAQSTLLAASSHSESASTSAPELATSVVNPSTVRLLTATQRSQIISRGISQHDPTLPPIPWGGPDPFLLGTLQRRPNRMRSCGLGSSTRCCSWSKSPARSSFCTFARSVGFGGCRDGGGGCASDLLRPAGLGDFSELVKLKGISMDWEGLRCNVLQRKGWWRYC